MSQLRLGRNPDGTRRIVLQEPARGRVQGYGTSTSHVLTLTAPRPVEETRGPATEREVGRNG